MKAFLFVVVWGLIFNFSQANAQTAASNQVDINLIKEVVAVLSGKKSYLDENRG